MLGHEEVNPSWAGSLQVRAQYRDPGELNVLQFQGRVREALVSTATQFLFGLFAIVGLLPQRYKSPQM